MKKQNDIWIGTDQLNADPDYVAQQKAEFVDDPAQTAIEATENPRLEASRRDFLKYLGFGISAATIAACDIPVRRAVPYVVKPDTIVPGVATYFASTFVQGGDYCPVVVKTREGRPIKIEGNQYCGMTEGGTSARAQASVLSMYDTSRFDGPYRVVEGQVEVDRQVYENNPSWAEIDAELAGKMKAGAQVRIVSHTEMSPSKLAAVAEFKAKYPNTKHVQYDPVSASALLDANREYFGTRAIPSYRFDEAEIIVGIDCDFLGTWISPIEYAKQYAAGRRVLEGRSMSHHVQIESTMSLTGSNADNRIVIKPSHRGQVIAALASALGAGGSGGQLPADVSSKVNALAAKLRGANGKALVVSGSNNLAEQVLVNAINERLGSYGSTIDTNRWSMQRKGSDQDLATLVADLEGGRVDALIVFDGANPAYDTPYASRIVAALPQVDLRISLSGTPNETSALCNYIAPAHHYLESWSDVEAKQGHISVVQPAIQPIFASVGRHGTRQEAASLLVWAGSENYNAEAEQPMYDYLQQQWQSAFAAQGEYSTFQAFWDASLHDGIITLPATGSISSADGEASGTYRSDLAASQTSRVGQPAGEGQEVTFFETVNQGNGVYANNPWLQEMPDPVQRTAWGNYLSIPVSWEEGATEFSAYQGLNEEEYKGKADIVDLAIGDMTVQATAVRQFGLKADTFAIAVGYGRQLTGMAGRALGEGVGVNVYPMLPVDGQGYVQYHAVNANVSGSVDVEEEFASVQYHHSMGLTARDEEGVLYYNNETGDTEKIAGELTDEQKKYLEPFNVDEHTIMAFGSGMQGGLTDRSIIFQGDNNDLQGLKAEIADFRSHANHLNDQTLYPFEEYKETIYDQGHWWAMHVDLNACIGCGACEVACVAENNVPVVGKYEVWRHHEMKWMRIDRYFYGDYENPRAVYQPMMCQHCDNAPCENVCPVNASNHSNEGLNQMAYNRCIGTRYCANNCPYKVRRFNWLDYTTADLFASNEPTINNEELPFGADNLTRMVLNPDVTVRSRGVIEKCSFCAQRLQSGKLTAKMEGRRLRDSDVRPACQTACPTGAITFGDRNNPEGDVAKLIENPLNYRVLEEVNVQSSVFYAAKVRNGMEELEA
ncbi:4Fe-4S ferredoxin [Lewinellaceae bacterium SD302]|nr:4Fe-4S ferredoxin [Lewinellaceae bacterium SD302]